MTVKRLLYELDSEELTEWAAYFHLEGVEQRRGEDRSDLEGKMRSQRRGHPR